MKAVVLVAGKGTRMAKHYEGPKHLLPLNGKPVIEHTLDNLPPEIDGLVLVVGGPHEQTIRDHFKNGYKHFTIEFAVQKEQLGLAHAFWAAKECVTGRWLGMVGDDYFGAGDLQRLLQEDMAVLAHRIEHPENFGVLVVDKENYLVKAVEKPKEFVSDLVSTAAMVMDETFFELEGKLEPSGRGEYETPDAWMKLIYDYGKKIKIVEAETWLPINDKDQLAAAERVLKSRS
jgi:dTDP-glucose pyrophosphorylase